MSLRFLTVILLLTFIYPRVDAIGQDYRPIEIRLGPFKVLPMLEVSELYDDNIFFNNLARKSSLVTHVRSGFQLGLKRKVNRYAFTYAFQSQQYHASPQDNYVDQYIDGRAHIEPTRRNRIEVDASFMDSHYRRGTNFSQSVTGIQSIKDPDAFHQISAQARYRYGSRTAKANLELIVGISDIEFINNRQQTRPWDRMDLTVTPGFYYRVFPKTYSLIQVENTVVDYKNEDVPGFLNPDYTKQRYLFGAAWEPLAKTRGTARLGYLRQLFDVPRSNEVTGLTWDANILWEPRSYSQLSLSVQRDIFPTVGFGTSRLIERYGSTWLHNWNRRVSTELSATYQNVDSLGSGRQDEILGFRLNANYYLGRWLGIGLNYTYLNQQSTFGTLDFEQNVIMLYIAGNPVVSKSLETPWQRWY
jgi:hypothetical protein